MDFCDARIHSSLMKTIVAGLLTPNWWHSGGCDFNAAEGKMAKLIVSCESSSSSRSTECCSRTDCMSCMQDSNCMWKRDACVTAPSSMSEKDRNEIKLSKFLYKSCYIYIINANQFDKQSVSSGNANFMRR